jgi:hypothetical protein
MPGPVIIVGPPMSQMGHSRPGRAGSKSGYVRYAAESGSNFRNISGAGPPPACIEVDFAAHLALTRRRVRKRLLRFHLCRFDSPQCRRVDRMTAILRLEGGKVAPKQGVSFNLFTWAGPAADYIICAQ